MVHLVAQRTGSWSQGAEKCVCVWGGRVYQGMGVTQGLPPQVQKAWLVGEGSACLCLCYGKSFATILTPQDSTQTSTPSLSPWQSRICFPSL